MLSQMPLHSGRWGQWEQVSVVLPSNKILKFKVILKLIGKIEQAMERWFSCCLLTPLRAGGGKDVFVTMGQQTCNPMWQYDRAKENQAEVNGTSIHLYNFEYIENISVLASKVRYNKLA